MNDKINEFKDFANQTKAILEKFEVKKPIKKLKILQIFVIILGFLALLTPTVLYIIGFSTSTYMITGLILCVVFGIFLPVLSVLKKERVCMFTYVLSLAISTVFTFITSSLLNYFFHIFSVGGEKRVVSGLFLHLGWPVIPLAFLMLLICIIVYFCFKNKIREYSFEPDYTEVSENE